MASQACGQAAPACRRVEALLLTLLLALLVGQAAAGTAGPLTTVEEGAVMRTLRQRLADAVIPPDGWHGWQPGDTLPHCSWRRVECSSAGHVTSIVANWDTRPPPSSKAKPSAAHMVLLPELARFGSLHQLRFELHEAPPIAAIPPQWGMRGAFPALEMLHITVHTLDGPLFDVQPGALPRLTSLHIEASNRTTLPPLPSKQQSASLSRNSSGNQTGTAVQRGGGLRSAVPASWGASPEVLPVLEELTLVLQVVPPLPAAWAHGFRRLRSLFIAPPTDVPQPAAAGNVLPPDWAAGFPALRWLNFMRLGLTGTFPTAWEQGGFPSLTQLSLGNMALSGPLPAHIFETHPHLTTVNLEMNNFTGTLPVAWAASQSVEGLSVRANRLSGPLFHPAWLAPGALPHLKYLVLAYNAALTGTLPPALPWPELTALSLAGTGLKPSTIPPSWCNQPNAAVFDVLSVPNGSLALELPRCLIKAMPDLTILEDDQVVVRMFILAKSSHPASRRNPPAAALVPLALLVLAGAAGLLWRRRCLHERPASRLHTHADASEVSLLVDGRASERDEGPKPRGGSSCSRRYRIESMLRSQLSQPGQRIELVPLERLPAALTHQVGSLRRGSRSRLKVAAATAAAMPATGYARLQAVDEEQQHNGWGSFGSFGSGGNSNAGLLEAGASGPAAPTSRQWALPTDSLRLAPGELEMRTAPDGRLCLLGEGSSSAVYLGRLGGYEDVAVKVAELAPGMDSRRVWDEVSLLRTCVHRRLVALLGVACQGQLLMLVMELMRGGDLHSALQRPDTRDALRWAARGRQVALDVAEALAFLHSCGVQHADLKPSNVMLTAELRAKLTDLGVAQRLGSRSRQAVGGTTQYAAPEQLLGLPCTTQADVYSLGVLLTVLCTGRPLAARGQLCLPTAPDDCPQPVLALIQECIRPDPLRRPTAEEALRRLRASDVG